MCIYICIEVTDPPTFSGKDPSPMYIVEFKEDRYTQTHVDDVLLLTTIIFDGSDSMPRKERLRVQWMQCHVTRDNVLDFFRVTWYCRRSTVLCNVFHNEILWPITDQSLHHMDYGDHVRLQIRSSGPGWCDMEHSESITQGRRIFASSDEEDIQYEPAFEEEDGTTPSRSRSRSRHSNFEDEMNAVDSDSLLQIKAWKTGRRTVFQDITNLPAEPPDSVGMWPWDQLSRESPTSSKWFSYGARMHSILIISCLRSVQVAHRMFYPFMSFSYQPNNEKHLVV